MNSIKFGRKITKPIIFLFVVLACVLLIKPLVLAGESKGKLAEILLTQPVFAQQATAFPADEAGISAYVNVGQNIDLAKAKSALRGIQAEGDNHVIGIIELTGLPEEEFPHMYISSDGWILAYYSKFAPASRIMHWGKYGGGTIETTTLQEAISNIGPTIGVDLTQLGVSIGYYNFKYPDATNLTIAVDVTEEKDTFSYSIPSSATLYEASFSHYSTGGDSRLYVNDQRISETDEDASYLDCNYLEDPYLLPDKSHVMEIRRGYRTDWLGVAIVFIYR